MIVLMSCSAACRPMSWMACDIARATLHRIRIASGSKISTGTMEATACSAASCRRNCPLWKICTRVELPVEGVV